MLSQPQRFGSIALGFFFAVAAPVAAAEAGWASPALRVGAVHWSGNVTRAGPAQRAEYRAAGGPVYLWFTLHGSAAALARMRRQGSLAIAVHWTRENGAAPGAPDLVTPISVGRPGVVPGLAGEVRRQGDFDWHGWAEKTSLSPGRWLVSLTGRDGRPLACTAPPRPCRFSLDVAPPA